MLPNKYKFCSVCGGRLKLQKGNLACTKCPFVNYRNARPTVTALIIRDGKMLLAKRNKDPFKGWWDLLGGFVDKGEDPIKAIKRELREEVGLDVKVKNIFGIYTGTYDMGVDYFYTFNVIYVVEPKSTDVAVVDKEEIAEFKWFAKDQIPEKIAFDSNKKVIKDFLKQWN